MTDDDPLAGIDLHAVGAPRAPERFARGVMTRFEAVEAAMAGARHRRRRQLAWIGSSAAAVAVAIAVVAWLARPSEVSTGSYATDTPHHLVIGEVEADLGSGAAVSWKVTGDRIVVEQHGDATWTVPAGKTLRVEAAGVGSVDAEDATLHVEARMNLMDKKGVTVASALVVTAIAVTVIHGRATVHGDGKDQTVTHGSVATIARRDPAADPKTTAIMFVYSGNAAWAKAELASFEAAFDGVTLPPGQVGAVAYSTGANIQVPLGPTEKFTPGQLGDAASYTQTGSDLVQGVTMGLAELARATADRKVLVIVGDGNDTNNQLAPAQLEKLTAMADSRNITMRALLLAEPRPQTGIASMLQTTRLPMVSSDDLSKGLVEATGGTPVKSVAPSLLEPLRIAGAKNIGPDDRTKEELAAAGMKRLVGSFKLCLDATGAVRTVDILKPTGAPAYDTKILAGMRQWRFRPYVVDGEAQAVCTAVTFIYAQ